MDTTDYSMILEEISEQLQQLNTNLVHAVIVATALVGCIIGFWAAKELLKIWL